MPKVVLSKGRYISIRKLAGSDLRGIYLAKKDAPSTTKANRADDTPSVVATNLVALKVNGYLDYGESELNAMKVFSHKNIVRYIDGGFYGSSYCSAMELGSCTLTKLIGLWGKENINISNKQFGFILKELLDPYIYISKKGLTTCIDMHGENILYFAAQKRLKLIDFEKRDPESPKPVPFEIAELVNYVLKRLDNNGAEIPIIRYRNEYPSEGCHLLVYEMKQHILGLKDLHPHHREIIIKMIDNDYSPSDFEAWTSWLSNNIEDLPEPKSLNTSDSFRAGISDSVD